MEDLFIYFDGVSAFGQMNGAIQVELAANCLDASKDGTVTVRHVSVGHLRCSPAAAAELLRAVQGALEMLENPEAQPEGSKSIN